MFFVIVMMTHFDYNSYFHPGHTNQKIKVKTQLTSQMITQAQSSLQHIQNSQGLVTLKPWYFKPKKSLFRVDDQQTTQKKKFNSLHWSQCENLRYAQFLAKYLTLVQGEVLEKRRFHLNRMMSKHVKTRSAEQCRSHHQKMLKSFKTIEGIIEYFKVNQTSVETSANLQNKDAEEDAKYEINCNKLQMNCQTGNSEEYLQVFKKENFFSESFHKVFDGMRYQGDIFVGWEFQSLPQLDFSQV